MDHTLKLLKQMAHGIAKQFGTSCEVVIHDLNKDLETSIVHIENGQVTNRKSGDGPSGIVLETLHKNAAKVQDKLSYLTRTEDGRILKSSTLYIRDADEKISYIFSINYDITALLTIDSALGSLLHTEPETDTYTVSKPHSPQTITRNVEELLNDLQSYAEDRGCQPSGHGTFRGGKSPHVPRKFSAIQCHTTRKTEPHGRKIRTWFTLHQG